MDFDIDKYYELGLNETGMTPTEVKEYAAKIKASPPGMFHAGVPVDPAGERVMVRINYNPITRNYTADYHTKEVAFGHRDERGYALLDCDELSEPDPDKLITFPDTSEEEEEADKKRKIKMKKPRKTKKKKKKKTQAPNLEEPKDNPSSPMDPVIYPPASGTQLQPRVKRLLFVMRRCCKHCRTHLEDEDLVTSEDEEGADKKRKTKKVQVPNLEEPKDNTSPHMTMGSDLIETLADKNLDPSASTASGTKPEAEGQSILEDTMESTFVENLDQSTAPVIN